MVEGCGGWERHVMGEDHRGGDGYGITGMVEGRGVGECRDI